MTDVKSCCGSKIQEIDYPIKNIQVPKPFITKIFLTN
jgi:hypothetical protein